MGLVSELLVVAHALTGITFFGGLVGRWIVLGLASRAGSVAEVQTLTRAGRGFEAALQDATGRNELTPRLAAAFHEPAVRAAHVYELAAVTLILVLMMAKPL